MIPQNRVENTAALKQAAKETKRYRESKKILVIGETGTGKTHETMRFFNEEYTVSTPSKSGKKVLIYDVNGEFDYIDPISLFDIPKFNIQKVIEIRRILARDPITFEHLGDNGKYKLFEQIMKEKNSPRGMGLLLEDLNNYTINANSEKMIDVLTTNRHKELDLFIHLQTFRAVPPRIWGNLNILRLHRTGDDVLQIKSKVKNFRLTLVGNILVQNKCIEDPRFFVFINYDDNTVSGNFNYPDIKRACQMLLHVSPQDKLKLKMFKLENKNFKEENYVDLLVKEFTQPDKLWKTQKK